VPVSAMLTWSYFAAAHQTSGACTYPVLNVSATCTNHADIVEIN